MSRIMAPDSGPALGRVPVEEDSDSDDSGDEGQGMRIAADPSPQSFPMAKFAQDRAAAAAAPAAPAPVAESSGFAAPAPPSTKFAVPPRKKSNEFIPSATFSGPKPGFVYKKGPDGLGYYKDANFAQNNVGTALTNASRPGSGLPAPKSSESRDMLQLLKQKELEENSKPKSSTIPMDGDSDEEDEQPKRQNSGGMFSKLTKRISKSAEEIRANIQKRKAEEGNGGSAVAEEPMEKPDTPRPGAPSRPPGPAPPPVFAEPPAIQKPTPPQRQAPPQPKPVAKAPPSKPQRESPDGVLEIVCEDLGFGLPSAVMGVEGFANVVRAGNLLFTSSHGPQLPTSGFVRGRLGEGSMNLESAQVAASLTTLSLLKSLVNELGGLSSVKGVVKITAQVACVDEKSTTDLVSIFEPMRNVLKAIFSCNEPVISVSGVTCLPYEIPLQAEVVFELL